MPQFWRCLKDCFHPFARRQLIFAATVALVFFTASFGFAQSGPEKPSESATTKKPEIREELILKNGDRLTGRLLNSTGKEITFKSDLAGEVTVAWDNVEQLKSTLGFAIIPKNIKDARNSALVAEGAIKIGAKEIVVYPRPATKSETSAATTKAESSPSSAASVATATEIPSSSIGHVVDDSTYQKEIHRNIGWRSGWSGHITTGTTMVFATQNSYLFQASAALKRIDPSVAWLNPRLRTTVNFALSAGQATQPDEPKTITNIYHADAERDRYFSPRGYVLQAISFDHNYSQGLVLQQNYGTGVGATLFKQGNSEFDLTVDLHYENQQFNAAANVSYPSLDLIGSSVTEAYTHEWDKLRFDEKLLADTAFNDASAFSASGKSSVRMPVYKNLGFAVSATDNLLNNPQIGFKKNSFQFSTGFSLDLH